jgi:geranylgeranyl pyrophosphate synthase
MTTFFDRLQGPEALEQLSVAQLDDELASEIREKFISNGAPPHGPDACHGHPCTPRVPDAAEFEAMLDLGWPLAPGALGGYFAQALLDPLRGFLAHPGKAIRAQLVKAAYALARALGPAAPGFRSVSPDAAAAPAGACAGLAECIELIHAGSLIIDDVQDSSSVRRGQPTLHLRYGIAVALNAGSWLYFQGLAQLHKLGLPADVERAGCRLLHTRMLRAHCGQALDVGVAIDQVPQADVRELCLATIRLKSGELTALALLLGAYAGGAGPALLETLDRFGHDIGMALQMFDDLNNLQLARGDSVGVKRLEDLYLRRPSWLWAVAATETGAADYEKFKHAVSRLPNELPLATWLGKHALATRARAAAERFMHQRFDELRTSLPEKAAVVPVLAKLQSLACKLSGLEPAEAPADFAAAASVEGE